MEYVVGRLVLVAVMALHHHALSLTCYSSYGSEQLYRRGQLEALCSFFRLRLDQQCLGLGHFWLELLFLCG